MEILIKKKRNAYFMLYNYIALNYSVKYKYYLKKKIQNLWRKKISDIGLYHNISRFKGFLFSINLIEYISIINI